MKDARTVANRLLTLAQQDGGSLTPMQLLKLVYMAHGWMLGLKGRPLIRDDVEAWQYGPVIPRLYNAVRGFKGRPIEGQLRDDGAALDADEIDIVDQVYGIYGRRTGPALSRLTHQPNSPWAKVYTPGAFGVEIPNDIIEDHYAMLAKRGEEAA